MAKGNNARDKVVREKQKELVCRYRAKSYSFREIAETVSKETAVKISHVTAFNDYMQALEEAKKQAEKTAAYGLISEIEKLDRLEHQYWIAWDKSLGSSSKKKIRKNEMQLRNEMQLEEVEQNGEVAFLNGIKACIELRCKMMGYITSNVDIKSAGKELAVITGMTVT
ncbi:MAG: hypothetical protein FWF53_06755 [Candidatus Azobacteroides sp.]|nr:hypothetical protein [Candidatus Azobacteroides sp.]